MSQFMESENRLRAIRETEGRYRNAVEENERDRMKTAAEMWRMSVRPGLRPASHVKRDWRGSGRIWKAAAFCAAGSVAFAIVVLFSLQAFFPGAF